MLAPSQPIVAVHQPPASTTRQALLLRWGLVPSWASDQSVGHRMINARSETAHEKPSFRTPFRQQRCLVLADGFYEWQKRDTKDLKLPHFIHLPDHRPFSFAGLWEPVQFQDGVYNACAILTTQANSHMQPIHDRMPVILSQSYQKLWLNGRRDNPDLCRVAPTCRQVGSARGAGV